MTVRDKFIVFANALPSDKRESVEKSLASLMDSVSADYEFTPAEMGEIKRRMAEVNPEYSDPADIARIFGKPFKA